MIEKMSESSRMPLLSDDQVWPPSDVFHPKCHVPAKITLESCGEIASECTFLMVVPSDSVCQCAPASSLRKIPCSAPTTSTSGLTGASAKARMLLSCIAGMGSQLFPPSVDLYMAPRFLLSMHHSATYIT